MAENDQISKLKLNKPLYLLGPKLFQSNFKRSTYFGLSQQSN